MSAYDDVVIAMQHYEFDRAIQLIEQLKAKLKDQVNTESFELTTTEEMRFEKTTDFLPFHGWEAA